MVASASKRSEEPVDKNSTGTFHFTEPGPVMPGVSLNEYFTATTSEELAKIIDEAAKDPSDKEKRDGGSKMISDKKMTMEGCPAEIQSHIEFVSDYTSYLKALGVNAASTISGYGQSASVSGGYLDESTFSSNSLTYIASISINKQRRVPHETFTFNAQHYEGKDKQFPTTFGNRFIQGFDMGGKLMARIMLTFDESSNKEEIKAAAEASFGFWGVSGSLSTDVKNNLEKLSKQAKVTVKIFYQGDIGRELQSRSEPSDKQNSAQQIFETAKSWSDTFLDMACGQDYRYEALLDRYTNIGNFPDNQSIPHYTSAGAIAYLVLGEMVKNTELRKTLQKQGVLNQEDNRQIQQDEIRLIGAQKNWIRETANNPGNAQETVLELFKLSDAYYKKWTPRLAKESSQVDIKAFNQLQSLRDPDTKAVTTYDCSQWYEWYGKDGWTWSRVRFCLPTQTEVFKLTVFRERSQYLWGSAWYWEKDAYPSYVTVGVDLKRINSKPGSWKFSSGETTRMSFNVGGQQEKLQPGRYKVQANFYQMGPYWDETPLGKVADFDITVSRSS
ncbi:subtilisin-like protease [Beauveria brongniartii RCEF 3172]|uniref:Subtilisin-like protease n=1 Tax=Beauveria brongniartii RCEF 3172 TaxID=1081107 RepID=A0A167GLI0_9HYPO|nr:subtilisin-like protease [Beauveria brongniartii RCEF 3172]